MTITATFVLDSNTTTTAGQQQLTWNNEPHSTAKFAGDINQVGLHDITVTLTSNCQSTFSNQKYTIQTPKDACINATFVKYKNYEPQKALKR